MKKSILTGVALVSTLFMTAQVSVVKEAEHAAKSGKTPEEVVAIITPAFTDPTTANDANTYLVPGNANYKSYDDKLGLKTLGKLSQEDASKMYDNLLTGYNYMMKALSLDTVVDAKGKVKTKHSKNIINTIGGHYNDLYDAGYNMYNEGKYDKSYEAYCAYIDLTKDPRFAKAINNPCPDSIFSQVQFNAGLAAYFAHKPELTLDMFQKSYDNGNRQKILFDYAITVATESNKDDVALQFAELAMPLYGGSDASYINRIANHYLNTKEYDKALSVINNAIANDPENAQYYIIKGTLIENTNGSKEEAKALYEKALSLNADDLNANFLYGKMIYDEAMELKDNAPVENAAYVKVMKEEITPRFEEAIKRFNKVYETNNDVTDALRYLYLIYYNMNDEAKMKEIEMLLNL